MRWVVEYYEQADTTQPAEAFEVSLKRHHKKLGAKLRAIAAAIEVYGPQLGGGLIEPCHNYKGPHYLILTRHLNTGEITSIRIR